MVGCQSSCSVDAFAGLIAGWECSLSKETAFVERAIRQAAALRARHGHPISGQAVHHSDAGSQHGPFGYKTPLPNGPWCLPGPDGWPARMTRGMQQGTLRR